MNLQRCYSSIRDIRGSNRNNHQRITDLCIRFFSLCYDNLPEEKWLKGRKVRFGLELRGYNASWQDRQSNRHRRQLVSLYPRRGAERRGRRWDYKTSSQGVISSSGASLPKGLQLSPTALPAGDQAFKHLPYRDISCPNHSRSFILDLSQRTSAVR